MEFVVIDERKINLGQLDVEVEENPETSGQPDVTSLGLLFNNAVTGADDDTLIGDSIAESAGSAFAVSIVVGFDVEEGTLDTGLGNDTITAVGNATAAGEAVALGIDSSSGIINLKQGNDEIFAEATATSENGESEAFGIFGGKINAGLGDDVIKARSNDELIGSSDLSLAGGQGFGGGVEINLEGGNDTLLGFGEASANGGKGTDTLQFEFSLNDFVKGGGTVNDSADFTFAGITFETAGFEKFQFDVDFESGLSNGETFNSFSELQQAL